MQPCVYMMASKRHGTIYIGATSDLSAREWEHVSRAKPKSFTARYNVRRLVWFEDHETMASALQRERSLKRWRRQWKIDLIESVNPHWHPLDVETGQFIFDHD